MTVNTLDIRQWKTVIPEIAPGCSLQVVAQKGETEAELSKVP